MKKLIIFDFDGVIVDSFGLAYSIEHEADPTLTKEQYSQSFSHNPYDFCKEAENVVEVPVVVDFFAKYEPVILETECVSGMKELIQQLAEDFCLVIVSSTREAIIKKFLAKQDLTKCFVEIFGPEVDRDKTKKINLALKKFGVASSECLFVTDTLGDIREATKAEVDSIAVTWGFQNREMIEEGKPLAIVENVNELVEAIRKNK